MPNLQLALDFVPPYRLRYHSAGQPVRRGFWLDGRPVVIQLEQEHDDGPVTARAYSTSPLDGIADRVSEAAHRMISARDDLNEFRAAIAGDREMAALVAGLPGLKPLRVPDLWTALIWGLIDQQLSNVSGREIRQRLAERFGPSVDVDGERVAILPDARTILDVTHQELCEAGLSERKAEYAKEIAEEVMAGEVDLERIAAMPLKDALQHIVDLRGVGMWTAEVAAIFGLGVRDVLPADDLGIRKAIGQLYHLPQLPERAEVERIGERWAGWRSYAAVYLWYAYPRSAVPAGAR